MVFLAQQMFWVWKERAVFLLELKERKKIIVVFFRSHNPMPCLAHRKCMPQVPEKKAITIPWVSGT